MVAFKENNEVVCFGFLEPQYVGGGKYNMNTVSIEQYCKDKIVNLFMKLSNP